MFRSRIVWNEGERVVQSGRRKRSSDWRVAIRASISAMIRCVSGSSVRCSSIRWKRFGRDPNVPLIATSSGKRRA
jgi:hypothetical protein